jgi:serine/threonine protein kinase
MRQCLTCLGEYEDARRICPRDGDVLLDMGKHHPETGRVLGGRYVLGNLLGEGGMGLVFEATCKESGDEVAVKLLKSGILGEDGPKRFRLEAEAAAAIDHPGVVKIIEFHPEESGSSYLVMERLRGPTLEILRRAGKLSSVERVVEFLAEVAEIVAAAHQRGILHRDLKPSNIILHRLDRERSTVKVLDFGIAKFLDGTGERLTSTGQLLGTLLYMSPEQVSSARLTPASDVYSLGVLLFEALTGRLPFKASNPLELLRLHTSHPAPALSSFRPDVSHELDELVARCLRKRPQHRFAGAGELAGALRSVRASRPLLSPEPSLRKPLCDPSLWVGTLLEERYSLEEWIGPGRFGSHVYRAIHAHAGSTVAVRLWEALRPSSKPALLEAFRREAQAMNIRHPNLISILDLGVALDCVYIVTSYIESISLRTLMAREPHMLPRRAASLVRPVISALGALHQSGLVSGGLSPEAMRVSTAGGAQSLLISPFGLSSLRQLDLLLEGMEESVPGERFVEYLAPEQRAGEPPDARSDLYCIALILLEMIRRKPAMEDTTISLARAGLSQGVRHNPPLLTGEWEQFFARALASEPQARFQSAAEMLCGLPE